MSTTTDLEKCDVETTFPQKPLSAHCVEDSRRASRAGSYEVESIQYEGRDSTGTFTTASFATCPPNKNTIDIPNDIKHSTWRGHLTVFGGFLALFCTFGQMNAFGTFQTYYARHQLHAYPPSTISWIGSLQLWVFFFSGWPVGWLFDMYGPKPLMLMGTICFTLSLILTSFSVLYYQYILCQGILFGLGVGLLFYPSLASISTHFTRYRATALGICAAGSSLGGVMFPVMLQKLFERVGFGWAVRVAGLMSGLICLISVFTVTTARPLTGSGKRDSTQHPGLRAAVTGIVKDTRFVLLAAGSCLVALGLFIPYFYIVDFAQSPHLGGLDSHLAFLTLAVLNAGGVFGRIAPAILSDVVGRFNLLVPSTFLSGTLTLTLWLTANSIAGVLAYSVLYGFCSGAFISVITPCVAQISDIREIGSRIGGLYTIISFPALVGGPIAGALLAGNPTHSFNGLILFSGTTVIAGSVFILAAKLAVEPKLFAKV